MVLCLNDIDDSDDDNNDIGNEKVQSPTHSSNHVKESEKLCDECKQKVAETQKLQRKYEKLNAMYTNLCVRFAESQMNYNDLLKVNGVNTSKEN